MKSYPANDSEDNDISMDGNEDAISFSASNSLCQQNGSSKAKKYTWEWREETTEWIQFNSMITDALNDAYSMNINSIRYEVFPFIL